MSTRISDGAHSTVSVAFSMVVLFVVLAGLLFTLPLWFVTFGFGLALGNTVRLLIQTREAQP